jgi:sulfur-oxidizing protein SoxX
MTAAGPSKPPHHRGGNERPRWTWLAAVVVGGLTAGGSLLAIAAPSAALPALRMVGDSIPEPLDGAVGDAARGRALLAAREAANCVLCHALPPGVVQFAGDVGPPLAGVGARLTAGQLRLRVADIRRVQPQSIMPSYFRVEGLVRVAAPYEGKPILTAREVEDVVAYLGTLQ